MENRVRFVSKVSMVKTRTKANKNYYVYRINIPKEESEKLQLLNNDYIFVESAVKAKWYHMVNWKEMSTTWKMMPADLRNEITGSGIQVPVSQQNPMKSVTSPTHFVTSPFEQEQTTTVNLPYSPN